MNAICSSESKVLMDERHLAEVRAILQKLLPDVPVWAFGSRTTGRNLWRFSDLDLAVGGELSWKTRGLLSEAFEESNLPMKVDFMELPIVDQEFVDRVRNDFVPIHGASH